MMMCTTTDCCCCCCCCCLMLVYVCVPLTDSVLPSEHFSTSSISSKSSPLLLLAFFNSNLIMSTFIMLTDCLLALIDQNHALLRSVSPSLLNSPLRGCCVCC